MHIDLSGKTAIGHRLHARDLPRPGETRRMTWRITLALVACAVLSTSGAAQSDDAAYCGQLAGLALRYTGSAGGEGRLAPDLTTLGAIDDCNKGNFAAGIAALEKKLRNNGFTLPKR